MMTVAEIRPQVIVIAIGIRNRAWKLCSSISGSSPQTVVTVVSTIARTRARPAANAASYADIPARRFPFLPDPELTLLKREG